MSARAQIEGNVVADPEVRFTPSGVQVTRFSVADNRRWTDAAGTVQEQVSYFDVEVWRDQAANVAHSVAKGDRVVVQGSLRQDRWEAEDGSKRSKVVVVADTVAVALRWAIARPEKVERDGREPAPVGARRPAATEPGDDEAPYEEPF